MSKKSAVLSGQKGDAVHVPASKRGKALSKSHELYLNPDTISSEPEGKTNSRLAANTNSTKVK